MRTRAEAMDRLRFLEAVLPARARDTARLEAELRALSWSLTDRTHNAICDAIDDVMAGSGQNPNRSAAPADLTESADQDRNAAPLNQAELADEGSNADNDSFGGSNSNSDSDPLGGSNATVGPIDPFQAGFQAGIFPELAMGHTVALALISIKDHVGPKGLVQFIIEAAVRSSHLGAQEVVAAAFDAVSECQLTMQDVVMASLQAARDARNTRNISAREILGPAVAIASSLGNEVPVIIKEVFVAAFSILDSSMLRSSLLSVLGCAMGMGMTPEDIKDLMKAFSNEVEFGALGQSAAEVPQKSVRFASPVEAAEPRPSQPQRVHVSPGRRDAVNALVQFTEKSLFNSINDSSPESSAREETSATRPRSPPVYSAIQSLFQYVNNDRSSAAAAPTSAKRSADDEDDDDNDGARPCKKIKTESEDRQDDGE